MGLRGYGEVSKVALEIPRLGQPIVPISSLNEAWFHPNKCVIDSRLSERPHPSPNAQLRFWRSNARNTLAAEGVMAIRKLPILMASSQEPQS